MENNKGLTKTGMVSEYGFLCGYIEVFEKNGIRTEVFQYGGTNHYNIKTFDHNSINLLSWDTTHTLKEARKMFLEHKRKFHGYKR